MNRRELKVIGLSYSQSQIGSYVLVLEDVKSSIKLPIIIKNNEAQRISLGLEDMDISRPMTHDVIKNLSDSFGIDLQQVFIYEIVEGMFYTKLLFSDGIDEVEIESTVGDGIAFSILYQCPIITTREVLDFAGVKTDDEGRVVETDEFDFDEDSVTETNTNERSVEELNNLIEQAIQNEEYEIAAKLRDEIDKR
jgi:bifunctional DNase/RNase